MYGITLPGKMINMPRNDDDLWHVHHFEHRWIALVIFERFHKRQNQNDINYENSYRLKCLVFALGNIYVGFH